MLLLRPLLPLLRSLGRAASGASAGVEGPPKAMAFKGDANGRVGGRVGRAGRFKMVFTK